MVAVLRGGRGQARSELRFWVGEVPSILRLEEEDESDEEGASNPAVTVGGLVLQSKMEVCD